MPTAVGATRLAARKGLDGVLPKSTKLGTRDQQGVASLGGQTQIEPYTRNVLVHGRTPKRVVKEPERSYRPVSSPFGYIETILGSGLLVAQILGLGNRF